MAPRRNPEPDHRLRPSGRISGITTGVFQSISHPGPPNREEMPDPGEHTPTL